jgi:hypothetical protein
MVLTHPSRCRLSVAPSLFRGVVGQKRKEKKKERKQYKKGKKGKKERPPHSPRGTRELIRLSDGLLRHSFSWLASLLGCIVHTLVAISP